MGKISKQIFTDDGTFTVPAGVTRVRTISTILGANGLQIVGGGRLSTFFVDNNENIWAMGSNRNGQLGDGSTTDKSSPVLVLEGNKWIKIPQASVSEAGTGTGEPVYAIDAAGKLWGWGVNNNGELGIGNTVAQSSPVLVAAANGSTFKQVIPISTNGTGPSGSNSVLALDGTGAAWAWGDQSNTDILGIGSDYGVTLAVSSPTAVVGSHKFTKIFVSILTQGNTLSPLRASAWALDTSGSLWAWGSNTNGVLGVNTLPTSGGLLISSPTLVLGAATYSKVFTQNIGDTNVMTFLLDTSQNLWSVGDNTSGRLGIGISPAITAAISSPALVVGGIKWQAMNAHEYSTGATVPFNTQCGLDVYGNAWTWGSNTSGALGLNVPAATTAAVSSPVQVVGGVKFSQISTMCSATASGKQSFFGLDTSGQVWSWGDNADGILGVGDLVNRSSPTMVSFPVGFGRIQNIRNSRGTLICLDDKGHIYTWGYNTNGQTGVGTAATANPQLSSPVQVIGGRTFSSVYLLENTGSIFAVCTDGNIYAWGDNSDGNLGLNNVTPKSSPTLVVGNNNISTVSPQTIMEFDVTPGDAIGVFLRGSNVLFGNNQVGYLGNSLVVEFEQ